jgi:hypothetical protein
MCKLLVMGDDDKLEVLLFTTRDHDRPESFSKTC